MTEQNLMLYYLRDRANQESHKSGTSEDLQILRELRSEVMHMRASTLPPNLTRNLEARIESQTYEVRSLQRDQQTTQDSLHSWDEVKPHFVSSCLCLWKCCNIDVIRQQNYGTSKQSSTTSCGWPARTKRANNAESSFKIGCSSEYATSEHLENSSCSTQFHYSDDFFKWKYRSYSDSPWLWRTWKQRKQRHLLLTNGLNPQNSEVGDLASKAKSLFFFATSQSHYAMDWCSWGC